MNPFERPDATPGQDAATADLLRRVLTREAAAVRPSIDGLDRILAATRSAEPTDDGRAPAAPRLVAATPGVRRPQRAVRWFPVLAAAAAVTMLLGGLGAVRLGVLHPSALAALTGPAASETGRSTPAAQPLPVYLVECQHDRWALVREFVPTTLTAPDARLDAALRLAVAGTSTDPDHTSAWAAPADTVNSATVNSATVNSATVNTAGNAGRSAGETGLDLAADAVDGSATDGRVTIRLSNSTLVRSATGPGGPTAKLAVQQLVWTASAVTGITTPVRIQGAEPSTSLFGQVRLDRDFTRTFGADDPRAPVWVSSLSDGQHLARGTATVRGDAVTTATGSVDWLLRGADGSTVATGVAGLHREDGHPANVGERALWELTVDLPAPGRYRLEVSQSWPQAARTDPPWVDTKTLIAA